MEYISNPDKKLVVEIDGRNWARIPVKTHFIISSDKMEGIMETYVLPVCQKNDIVVLGQKIVSILQGRVIYKKDIRVGFWAMFLSKFAKKTPYGFSVGNPLKMQVAINLAGLPRIMLAGIIGIISKIFGVPGNFYRLAGHQISEIDGFYGKFFPQYSEMGILGPVDCGKLCDELNRKYGFSFCVADVNDLGGNILGRSADLSGKEQLILKILKDNPAGQKDWQTPIIIIRND